MFLVSLLKSAHSKPSGCFLTQKRESLSRRSSKEKYGDYPARCSSVRRHGQRRPGCVHEQRVCPPSPARVSHAHSFCAPAHPIVPVLVLTTPAHRWSHRHLPAPLTREVSSHHASSPISSCSCGNLRQTWCSLEGKPRGRGVGEHLDF